jgi:hypothetical protein
MPPTLRQHDTPFVGAEEVVIDAATHGLGTITIYTLIVQVLEPAVEGAAPVIVSPDSFLYTIDPETYAVTVRFPAPRDGTVRLTTIENVVEV